MKTEPIATVRNEFKSPEFIKEADKIISKIEFNDDFAEGLYKIENQQYIDVIFYFHRSEDYDLVTQIFTGETRGVFASRSPRRPNGLGVTTVKLIRRENNTLVVSGLDALDGTPVVDIKPSDFSFMRGLDFIDDTPINNPRFDVEKYISRGQTDKLLMMSAQIHGHYCPGLSMGVMATTHAMVEMKHESDGMEDLLAVVETNNCFSDGVQLVSGCTFGNNALIFKDYGKNAVSLVTRDGNGIRVIGRNDMRSHINQLFPEFEMLFRKVVVEQNHDQKLVTSFRDASREASFGLLRLPFDELFISNRIQITVPAYAPIEHSLECEHCHEMFMASRGKQHNSEIICNACLGVHHPFLDGHGIHTVQWSK